MTRKLSDNSGILILPPLMKLKKHRKNPVKVGQPLTKFSGPVHVSLVLYIIFPYSEFIYVGSAIESEMS